MRTMQLRVQLPAACAQQSPMRGEVDGVELGLRIVAVDPSLSFQLFQLLRWAVLCCVYPGVPSPGSRVEPDGGLCFEPRVARLSFFFFYGRGAMKVSGTMLKGRPERHLFCHGSSTCWSYSLLDSCRCLSPQEPSNPRPTGVPGAGGEGAYPSGGVHHHRHEEAAGGDHPVQA